MLEDRLVEKRMHGRLGHDYVGRAVPVTNKKGEIIGSFGTVEILRDPSVLNEMIVGKSPSFLNAYRQTFKAARYDASVMIVGETGTGKELFARLVVEESGRRDRAFITVNCASIPASLFESEMFGYEGGSFTGAEKRGKKGYFEMAQNGIIFLDEIGEMELGLQAKLLRVLETGKISRVGGRKEITVAPRIISATNKNLQSDVLQGKFRADLFFRLSQIIIKLPPLRERREDLDEYILRLFDREKTKWNKKNMVLRKESRILLKNYDFPGNVRELENILRRTIILCDGNAIRKSDIASQLISEKEEQEFSDISVGGNLEQEKNIYNLEHLEKMTISRALTSFSSITHAARSLGISRDTLYRKIKKYRLG
jgi:transcriptional regulator with PAS, ATPase and Fis domain